jgi:hypothetical protein
MSELWTPPDVTRDLREMTATHNRLLLEVIDFDIPGYAEIQRELQGYDPLLRIGKAKERAHLPGVRPGFWHVVRLTEAGPYYCQPLEGVDGEYAEPSLAMFDALRRADLQNPQVVAARQRADEQAALERERAEARVDEERQAEIVERWKAVSETSVSMSTATPWSQNAAGRKGTRKDS